MSKTSREPTTDGLSSMHSNDKKASNVMIYVIGIFIILAVILIAVLGSRTMIDSINRNANAEIESVQKQIENDIMKRADDKVAAANAEAEEARKALEEEQSKFRTEQITWAQENHIHWNEDGNPENEKGKVMDDPTTDVDEVQRAKDLKAAEEAKQRESEKEPVAAEDWWKDNPAITQDENGNLVHIVKRGETLSDIAAATGFTTEELASYNQLSSPSMIITGQVLKIPPEGPATVNGITSDKLALG